MPILKVKTQVREDMRGLVGNKKYHDENAREDVISYVLRADKAQGHIGGFAVNPMMAREQFEILAKAYGKDFGVRLRHMILSFSPDEKIDIFDAEMIAYQAAAYYGCCYQIIWACHTDSRCLNIHLVMNTVSYQTGMKYDGSKADYYDFRDHVNGILAPYGMYVTLKNDETE